MIILYAGLIIIGMVSTFIGIPLLVRTKCFGYCTEENDDHDDIVSENFLPYYNE